MKKYLIIETYGIGDKLYTDSIVKELLLRRDTLRISIIVSKAGGTLKMPFYDERVELFPMNFAWNVRRGQRNPFKLLGSFFRILISFGGKFRGYIGLCPRGDLYQKIILKILRANPIYSYKFTKNETFLEKLLGWGCEPVMDARISFAHILPILISPKYEFLKDLNAPKRPNEVFLAPEASAPKRELCEDKWISISRELRSKGWRTILVVHSNTVVKKENFCEFSEVLDLPICDLIKRAQGVEYAIATDSFLGHLFAACGSSIVSIFGPQRSDIWAPAAKRIKIIKKTFDCSPCNKELSECPFYKDGKNCIQSISVEDILQGFGELSGDKNI